MIFDREPRFAGRFYPEMPRALMAMLQDMYGRVEYSSGKIPTKGIILPHGAYHYSGRVAMSVLKCVELPDTAIIFAPNHNGLGEDVNIVSSGKFGTPIGDIAVNEELGRIMVRDVPLISEDIKPHLIEHSIEIQLPMLKYLKNDIRIVPLLLKKMSLDQLNDLIGNLIAFFKTNVDDVLFIATSDLSHYENYEETIRKDKIVLSALEKMDIVELRKAIDKEQIRMCGYECVAITIELVRAMGATSGIIRRYDTSSSIDGNYESVVGYAGVCFV